MIQQQTFLIKYTKQCSKDQDLKGQLFTQKGEKTDLEAREELE